MQFLETSAIESQPPSKRRKTGKPFRVDSKSFFMTYSQCPLDRQVILDFLSDIRVSGTQVPILDYIISTELHKDGNEHKHVYVRYKQKLNINRADYFDIQGFHPNFESTKSKNNVICYVCKDKEYITNMDPEKIRSILQSKEKSGQVHELARKTTREKGVEEGLKVLEHPKTARDLNLHGKSIRENLQELAPRHLDEREYKIEDFDINFTWDRKKTLVLWGLSNCGKTSLARALLPRGLFINNVEALRNYDPKKYDGFIIDEACFRNRYGINMNRNDVIALIDTEQDRQVEIRYILVHIPKHTPRIFTHNDSPNSFIPYYESNGLENLAFTRRIQSIQISRPLFRLPPLPSSPIVSSTPQTPPTTTTTTSTATIDDDLEWGFNQFNQFRDPDSFFRVDE